MARDNALNIREEDQVKVTTFSELDLKKKF